MFKKLSKRNLRTRKTSDEEISEDVSEAASKVYNVGMLKAERKKKQKSKKASNTNAGSAKKQSVLSFHQEDEEEGEFQLKKPSRSRRIAKHIKRINQEEKERNVYENVGNKYTTDTLNELRALSVQPPSFASDALPEDFSTTPNFTASQDGNFSDLKPGEIPDANRIHAARKQREMMRKYGSEYIPLENASNANTLRERQEQEDNSSDEDGPLVEMKGIIDDSVRVAGEIGTEGECALNRDVEFDEWEAELIKKGISTQQFAPPPEKNIQPLKNDYVSNAARPFNGAGRESYQQKTWSRLPQSSSPADAVKSVKSRIQSRLESIQQTTRTRQMDYDRANDEIEMSEKSAEKMEDLSSISNRYTFFQDVKAYVSDLLDCLTEKNAEIVDLENGVHKIWKDRAAMFVTRRQQDVRDESEDITASFTSTKQPPITVDYQKQTRIREREARRARRRARRQISGNSQAQFDGWSTDDEETSIDKVNWTSETERIKLSVRKIFDDVVEDFCDVEVILSHFLEWKEKYPDSYNDAYIGLCLPKIIAPYIRLQILDWNPLMRDAVALENMGWYKQLLFHGSKSNSDLDKQDSDNKLLAGLFDKVVMPKLIYIVGNVWDPLSKVQSHCLSMLLCRFLRIYPCMRAENRKCNDLLVTVCARIQQSIDTDAFIPIYPSAVLSNISYGPGAFFERQTWTCLKLFQNIFLFDGILSQSTLIELAFTLLLNRYVMLSLQISPASVILVHKCTCIVDAIPQRWLQDVEEISGHLEPFSRFLLHVAKLIHSELSNCNLAEERRAKGCMGQIGKLLSRIGSYELCQEIAELLGIDI